jgi:UPF0271 protein
MERCIDINSDVGESRLALEDGSDEALMRSVTSANIACGAHAGDAWTMERSVDLAIRYSAGVGAHPGYRDPGNFGRVSVPLSPQDLSTLVYGQISRLGAIARNLGTEIVHVKPHGALYHDAASDALVAAAIADGAARWSRALILVGMAGSQMLKVWNKKGLRTAGEVFADRRYEEDGSLRSRSFPDALVTDPALASGQALRLAEDAGVSTICIHSDTPNSAEIARAVKEVLSRAGFLIKPLGAQ